jgi:hypothetical protein
MQARFLSYDMQAAGSAAPEGALTVTCCALKAGQGSYAAGCCQPGADSASYGLKLAADKLKAQPGRLPAGLANSSAIARCTAPAICSARCLCEPKSSILAHTAGWATRIPNGCATTKCNPFGWVKVWHRLHTYGACARSCSSSSSQSRAAQQDICCLTENESQLLLIQLLGYMFGTPAAIRQAPAVFGSNSAVSYICR